MTASPGTVLQYRSARTSTSLAALVLGATLLQLATTPTALASPNGFRVESGGDQNFGVTGAIDQTSSAAISGNGVMIGQQGAIGTANFAAAAGPGITRASLRSSHSTVNNFSFNPHVQAAAATDLLISGPATVVVDTSINLHVEGTLAVTSCGVGSVCDIAVFLDAPIGRHTEISANLGLDPLRNNLPGLIVDAIPGGRHVHGDIALPISVFSNTPFSLTLALTLAGGGLGTGSQEGDFYNPATQSQLSFSPTGLLFNNLPAGYTASGENVVDNHWNNPFAPSNDIVVADCSDPLLASLTTVAGNLVIKNLPPCQQVLLPNLVSVQGDLIITGNTNATVIDVGSLVSVAGNLDISGNTGATVVDAGSTNQVDGDLHITDNGSAVINAGGGQIGGSVDITDMSGSGVVDSGAGQIGGHLDLETDAGQVVGTTAAGSTDVTLLNGSAAMQVSIPAGAFSSPVPFTITRLAVDPPATGTAADGTPATIDPIFSYQFVFSVPTLNRDANLAFTIDLSGLDAGDAATILNTVTSGTASIIGKSDAAGATYTAFPVCIGTQTPVLNACAAVSVLDANHQPTTGQPAFLRFEGVVGHFSSYGVGIIVKNVDVAPPVIARNTAADSCSLPGDNGWCRGSQTAGFSVSDAASSISAPCAAGAGASCTFTRSAAANGAAVTIMSGVVCDSANNCNPGIAAGPFKIDSVAPALAPTISPQPVQPASAATANANATDVTSGVASSSCDAVDTTVGQHTLKCTARDNAGNAATASVTYTVASAVANYALVPRHWPPPGSYVRKDHELELEVAIVDSYGRRLPDDIASNVCVRLRVSGPNPVDRCMRYDRRENAFEIDWHARSLGRIDLETTVDDPRLGGSLRLRTYVQVVPWWHDHPWPPFPHGSSDGPH